jgi:uncharacterized protein (TIGR00255 family)
MRNGSVPLPTPRHVWRANAPCIPPTADGLLAVRGIVVADDLEGRVDADVAAGPCLGVIRQALEALAASRSREGEALRAILSGHVETIAQLTRRAEADPASQPDAILARLKEQVNALLDASASFDEARLNAEAALLATKADIREEIDRLKAHVEAARHACATAARSAASSISSPRNSTAKPTRSVPSRPPRR